MKRAFYLVTALAALWLIGVIAGCGYAKHIDPPLFTYDTATLMLESARLHARDIGGFVCGPIANTHSMEPLIRGDDYLVYVTDGIENAKPGVPIIYHPEWDPTLRVCHRIATTDSYGLLVEGDNVDGQHPENHWRVTKENYIGRVIAIYRVEP